MLIYCSHAYGGNEDSKQLAEIKIRQMQLSDLDNTYISPVHAFGFLYHDVPYDMGMELCFDLLMMCDIMLVLSEPSEGVKREMELANKLHIPIEFVPGELYASYS